MTLYFPKDFIGFISVIFLFSKDYTKIYQKWVLIAIIWCKQTNRLRLYSIHYIAMPELFGFGQNWCHQELSLNTLVSKTKKQALPHGIHDHKYHDEWS